MRLKISAQNLIIPYTWKTTIEKLPFPDCDDETVEIDHDNIKYKFVRKDYRYRLIEINDIQNDINIYIFMNESHFLETHYVKSVIHKKILINIYLDEHISVVYGNNPYISFNYEIYENMLYTIDSLFNSIQKYIPPFSSVSETRNGITFRSVAKTDDIITYCSVSSVAKIKVVFDQQGVVWGIRMTNNIKYIYRHGDVYYIKSDEHVKITSLDHNIHLILEENKLVIGNVGEYKFYDKIMFQYNQWCYNFDHKHIDTPNMTLWPRPLMIKQQDGLKIKLMNDGRIISILQNNGKYVFFSNIIRHGDKNKGQHYWTEINGNIKYELNRRPDNTYEFKAYNQGLIQGYYIINQTNIIEKIIYEEPSLKYSKICSIISAVWQK